MPKKQSPAKKKGHKKIIILGATIIVIVALASLIFPYISGGTSHAATIRIPRDATRENVSDTLTKYFGEEYASKVVRLLPDGEALARRHGAYDVPEGTSPIQGVNILTRGAQTPQRITINGVRQFDSFLPRIAAKFDFSADSLRKVLYSDSVLHHYGLQSPEQAQAIFLNDSYEFYWTATPQEVISKIADNYEKFWNEERRAKAAELGVTPLQLTIIASIVDEETNASAEKGAVGRLYLNRLQRGMKLQADPTVRYAVGDFTIRRVTGKHLQTDSPYNTYRYKGLPPGPIRTTSKQTLQAILDSEPSDYIYMCAKEDFSGTHRFANTYDEHLRNAKLYQAALDSLNIK